jgi:hypothetical protein
MEQEPLLNYNKSNNYYDNIDYPKLFHMLIASFIKPNCVYGNIIYNKCNICNNYINNIINNFEFYGLVLNENQIHNYLYHDIEYSIDMKKILYENRDIISSLYLRHLRRL